MEVIPLSPRAGYEFLEQWLGPLPELSPLEWLLFFVSGILMKPKYPDGK